MSFISKADFTSHIFEGTINAISNNDDSKLNTAIAAATAQALGYLGRFNTDAILATQGVAKDTYANLILFIKDLAKYHFIAVCNVNIDYEIAKERYEFAVIELTKIQKGIITPKGWALPTASEANNIISITSRTKRQNYI